MFMLNKFICFVLFQFSVLLRLTAIVMNYLVECCRCEHGHSTFIETVRTLARCHGQIDSEQKLGSR